MSITRIAGEIVFECDWSSGCSDILETNERDWIDAKQTFDEEHWLAIPVNGGFKHLCSYHREMRMSMAQAAAERLLDEKFL